MKYMGSKARFATDIIPILLKHRKEYQYYVEPFSGGMNIIDKMPGDRIAGDNNQYLIAMWKGIQNGVIYPKEIDKNLYDLARDVFNGRETRLEHLFNMTDDVIGWIGFMASANGRFFEGGYSGKSNTKIGTVRDYIAESVRNIDKQLKNANQIENIQFFYSDYRKLDIPENSLIYCDIPYANTKQYATSKGFDYAIFWDWVREKESDRHTVFISEYQAPPDFKCVWEKRTGSSLKANNKINGRTKSTEKLFKYRSSL